MTQGRSIRLFLVDGTPNGPLMPRRASGLCKEK
ncbi:hypothetical protein FHR94_003743 [Halomonas cerina]|uniref:Uncharacterized protein n=1 Tax=Halomonas cerina TaxID=447424 RepID=A0A839VE95_9GAMM|nr:hypothetical protein [Halomonas cerina]